MVSVYLASWLTLKTAAYLVFTGGVLIVTVRYKKFIPAWKWLLAIELVIILGGFLVGPWLFTTVPILTAR